MKRITTILAVIAIFIISARGQDFLNLNFESSTNLPGNPGFNGMSISVTNALPDWVAYAGPNNLSSIYYVSNSFPGDSTSVELEGGSLALSGDFSLGLLDNGASISQTGMVPITAESLEFEASSSVNLHLTLGGQSLSYSAISGGPGNTIYGANIPASMDGQMEALTFALQGPGGSLLDNIDFISVPEPSEYALISLSMVVFGLCRRRKLFTISQ